jgi:hypothetical protein
LALTKQQRPAAVVANRPSSAPAISTVRLPSGKVARVVTRAAFDKAVRNTVAEKKSPPK